MAKQVISNIKLGIFFTSGLAFLIILLYMIGKHRNVFGASFTLKAQFVNTRGLLPGCNIRFSGMDAGTVRSVKMINDTLIEVDMNIKKSMKPFIRKNAIASISTDGLMGNKLLDINPKKGSAPLVEDNDVLQTSARRFDISDMLPKLQSTSTDIGIIADNVKRTVERINNSTALWALLNDNTLPLNMRLSLQNMAAATAKANTAISDMQTIITGIKKGKGSVGAVLNDTLLAYNLNKALLQLQSAGRHADSLSLKMNALVQLLQTGLESDKGVAHALLKDSSLVQKIGNSMDHIEQGTAAFNENMEALKHSFLFKGYFRKQQKQQQRASGRQKIILTH